MQTTYSEVYNYWNNNTCFGGNQKFPFKAFKGNKVLEIGCGGGNDAVRFCNAGAVYTGIDLTDEAIMKTILRIRHTGKALRMNAEYLDFPDENFDLVYSFGVIHHSINPENIIKEAYRVLKKDGHICIMLYNKYSFKYLIEIMFLRKLLWLLHYPKYDTLRFSNPRPNKEQWLSWNTDNLGCPLSRVYTKKEAIKLLDRFNVTQTWTEHNGWFRILIGRK